MSEWKKYPDVPFPSYSSHYIGIFDDTDPDNDLVPSSIFIGFRYSRGKIFPDAKVDVDRLKYWMDIPNF